MDWKPSQQIKAKKWDERKVIIDRVEVKLDGLRCTLIKRNGEMQLLSRNGKSDFWPKFKECDGSDWLHEIPNDTIFMGELVLTNEPATQVITRLNETSTELDFVPFALPYFNGDRVHSFEDRDAYLYDLGAPVHHLKPLNLDLSIRSYATLAKIAADRRIEGFVLKQRHLFGWWKVKPVWTSDILVIAINPGLGKHRGRIGSLVCSDGKGNIIAQVGKGNDDLWRDLRPESCIGRIVEVTHEGVQAQGRLKFSSFVRWRDDKTRKDISI